MLSINEKNEIRECYKNLKDVYPNFKYREGQNKLVAEIAKTFDKTLTQRIIAAEAGTGSGKSIAYLLASIPIANINKLKVVISTATISLQEQLLLKDIPILKQAYKKPISVCLVKGRSNYCCSEKLANACLNKPEQLNLFSFKPKKNDLKLLNELYQKLCSNEWDGDKNNWGKPISAKIWQTIVADPLSCRSKFAKHRNCPLAKARSKINSANVLIINHNFLVADLELGGGKILPELEKTILVIDEAHHLAKITREQSRLTGSILKTISSLNKLSKLTNRVNLQTNINLNSTTLIAEIKEVTQELKSLNITLTSLKYKDNIYRFKNGETPSWLNDSLNNIHPSLCRIITQYKNIIALIEEKILKNSNNLKNLNQLLADIGFIFPQIENLYNITTNYKKENKTPNAKWIEKNLELEGDYILSISPIEIGFKLNNVLWQNIWGAALVSATIKVFNSFDYFAFKTGLNLNKKTNFINVNSPFDYQKQAKLIIPQLKHEPNAPEFTDNLIEIIPSLIKNSNAVLVLFSSYWQMHKVSTALDAFFKQNNWKLLTQGKITRQNIIIKHTNNIKNKKRSIIFGTKSFAEGLDLPGNLLTNLIITKLPFSVPTSPVEEAHAELITNQGHNPFIMLSVPETCKRLIQATGRLLRTEDDKGIIYILDRRLVTKRYGQNMLKSLPNYNFDIK